MEKRIEELKAAGLIRVRCVPDEEMFDDSYIDTWDVSEAEKIQEKKDLWKLIERDGVWGFIAEYKKPACACCGAEERWEQAFSCWGFVGSDLKEEEKDFWHEAAVAYDKQPKRHMSKDGWSY